MPASLHLLSAPLPEMVGRRLDLPWKGSLGSSPTDDLRIEHPAIKASHCHFEIKSGERVMRGNEVFLNGVRARQETVLFDGDCIDLGQHWVFRYEKAARAPLLEGQADFVTLLETAPH